MFYCENVTVLCGEIDFGLSNRAFIFYRKCWYESIYEFYVDNLAKIFLNTFIYQIIIIIIIIITFEL